MVLEIRLSNFFSIKEEVILDLRAGNIDTKQSHKLKNNIFQYDDIKVLKTLALYGANASGKSNLIKVIRYCNAMIFESHNYNENTFYNYKKFKFDGYPKKPSTYFIKFVINDIEYDYSFSLGNNEILTEKLYYYPKGRIAKIFDRNESKGKTKRDKYSFGNSVIKRPFDVAESTSNKTLFVSRASQMDRGIPKNIFLFFHQTFILHYQRYSTNHFGTLVRQHEDKLLHALQLADSDIVRFKQMVRKEKGKSVSVNFMTEESIFHEMEQENIEIQTYHKYAPKVAFDFLSEESLGTQKIFFIMLTILDVIKHDKILLVDEIEDSLHPQIIEYIMDLFSASKKSQLIFTTHNTHILDLNKFRKDQIWFVNKKEDGSSDLYSLYDYKDFRDSMDVEKAYLQGRFDAVPIIDNSDKQLQSLLSHGK